MPGTYPFIDIAVLDAIRDGFARGDAMAVLTRDLKSVIWANGPGASLFGFDRIEDIIGNDPGLAIATQRQIMAADHDMPADAKGQASAARNLMVRLPSGLHSTLTQLRLSNIVLPDGTPARVLTSATNGAGKSDDHFNAVISGLGDDTTHAALLDAEGQILAATPHFADLGIRTTTLADLVIEVTDAPERIVKRRIRAGQQSIPGGIARLSDEPARHLLCIVAETAAAPITEAPAPQPAGPIVIAEKISEPGPVTPTEDDVVIAHEIPGEASVLEPVKQVVIASTETAADHVTPAAEEILPEPAAHVIDAAADKPENTTAFQFNPDAPPARFIWKIDADTAFTELSPEFSATLGAGAADVIGRNFGDVARVFGFDLDREIAGLLDKRDTWSGRRIFWPVEGTSLRTPVELAALPAYSKDRVFVGFRGFGVIHVAEAEEDPEQIGLALSGELPKILPETIGKSDTTPSVMVATTLVRPVDKAQQAPVFVEKPVLDLTPSPGRRAVDKVIQLAEHRSHVQEVAPAEPTRILPATTPLDVQATHRPEGGLTKTERNAFREIAERLRRQGIASVEKPVEPVLVSHDDPFDDDEPIIPLAADLQDNVAGVMHVPAPVAKAATLDVLPEAGLESPHNDVTEDKSQVEDDTALVDRLPVPVVIHSADKVHYINQALSDLTGYADIEAIEAAGGIDALFNTDSDDGKSDHTGMILRHADGSEQPVNAHLQSVPWRDGRALMLSIVPRSPVEEAPAAMDVTTDENMSSNERISLQTHIDELTSILDTATDGVVLIGQDGLIRSMNHSAAALFGYDREETEGRSFSMLFAIESQRAAMDYLNGLSSNGVLSVLNDGREVIGREAQGRFIPMYMTIGKLPASKGYCAVLRDITQWKRAEEELTTARKEAERASSQKTEFLARISHEIRTPLNAIIGFSELMADEKFGPVGNQRYRDYLRDINRSGNHVLALVNDLLDISKIEAGGLEMQFEAVSLNDAISEAVALMQPQANRERVIIRSSFPSNLPDIVADARSIKQVALNLLSNAVRFTQAGGQVIVSTSYELNGDVIMRVRDTGIGMNKAEIEQALKPFRQVNSLQRRQTDTAKDWRNEGTGLGLPLSKAMVEANRAQFSIDSSPGRGTVVEVVFPPTRVLAD